MVLIMASRSLCLVCGSTDDEVKKMHYFPANVERSKLYQENMGMKFVGDSLRHYRICSRHFTEECYVGTRLSKHAVPTLFPCSTHACNTGSSELNLELLGGGEGVTSPQDKVDTSDTIASTSYTTPVAKNVKGRLFKSIPNLTRTDSTPRKHHLMNMILKKEDQARKLKRLCKKRSADLKALSELSDGNVARQLFHGMSHTTSNFLASQVRCAVKNPKGRRWTLDDKVIALSIFKRSPKCYNFLRKLFALPTRRTLLDLLKKVPFTVGVNKHLFKHINESLPSKTDKLCVLLFDEMDIKEHFYYDSGHDRIIGFEDYGGMGQVSIKPANKALVFMCQGLVRNWKQPVAYYFCNNACGSNKFVQCLEEVLEAAMTIGGLDVVATVCDMGTNNVKVLKDMNSTLQHPYIVVRGKKIYTMFDPPHLLKCTVSLFRKYRVSLPVRIGDSEMSMEAKFSDIIEAHKIDADSPLHFRAMHKIKSTHLAPVMRFAMKVSIAAQVMSRTVAAFLYTLLSKGVTDQRTIATATFVSQVDELFDSFNGSQLNPGDKLLKCAISDRSLHLSYWDKAFKMINQWQYRRITKTGKLKETKPPSQLGWMVSIKAITAIWKYMKQQGALHLRPRYLNQDSLENLFGCIRGGCGSGDNPTCFQFVGSLKTQIVNGLTKSGISSTNCETDDHTLLSNMKNFLTSIEPSNPPVLALGVVMLPQEQEPVLDDSADKVLLLTSGIFSVAYVSGFLIKRIFKKMECGRCMNLLCSDPTADHNIFIAYKEWGDGTGKLTYPSEDLVLLVGKVVTLLEHFIPTYGGAEGIAKAAVNFIIPQVDHYWLTCDVHKDALLRTIIEGVCRIGLPWWSKRKNMDLLDAKKGKETKRKLKKLQHK